MRKQEESGAAKAEAQPQEWRLRHQPENTNSHQRHYAIMEGEREIARFYYTKSPVDNEINTRDKAGSIIDAHNATLSATPPPQGQVNEAVARLRNEVAITRSYGDTDSPLSKDIETICDFIETLISSLSHEVHEPVEKTKE